jgi:DNA mismatch repair ATPase MutS
VFLVNTVLFDVAIAQPSVSTLAPLKASENPKVKREITAAMFRSSRLIWLANSPRYLDLLSRYNALALLLPSGRYLMVPETAANDLALIRSATHEDNEVLMQQEEKLHAARYNRLMRQILDRDDIMKLYYVLSHYKEPKKEPDNIIFNDLISKAFEILFILDEGLVYPDELKPQEREFITLMRSILQAKDSRGRYKNFSQVFFDTDKRTKAIKALQENKNERFYRVANANSSLAFKEPTYGDENYWYGNLGISVNDLANLGLIRRRYEYGLAKDSWYLDDVFSQFRGAPSETIKRLIAQIQKPERNRARIVAEHEKILAIIDFMQRHYGDQTVKKLESLRNLVGTFSLQNSNRRADPFMGGGSESSFGEAMRILRNKHYPMGKWYEDGNPRNRPLYEQMDDFPETTRVLLHLAIMILVQKEIYELLPEDATGAIKEWRDNLKKFLDRKDIRPFLEREQFLELAVQVYNAGIPRNIAHKYDMDRDDSEFSRQIDDRRNEALENLVKNKQFLELVEMHKDIWKIDDSAKHAFLRHFPHGRINGVLSEMDYYARACLMILEDNFKLPNIHQPTGTIKLDEYKNPHLLGKGGQKTGPILSLLDLFGRMGKEDKPEIQVQPVNIDLGGDRTAMLLSGPNMGGKTTTARGIGLAVLLTQMGLPLPADNPQLGLFKNVYTIFPQPEQLHAGYGYFGMLIKELTDLIKVKKAGPGDLIILDEVPTGTDYYELVAVATVLLENLIKSGATVIVTGHLKKAIELVADRTGQQPLMHTVSTEGGEIKPDFKLVPGIAKKSYAIELMQKAGFPQTVQDLARSYYDVITGVADSHSIPRDLKVDIQTQTDVAQLAKEADVHSVETVLKVLYPANHFALSGRTPVSPPAAQEEVINEIKSLASGSLKPKTQEELAESHRLIGIFVSKGINWLQTVTHNLSFLNAFTQERMRWKEPTPQEVLADGRKNLEMMEQLLRKFRQNLESLKTDEKVNEILAFLTEQIDNIPKLRNDYLDKDLSKLDKKAAQKVATEWTQAWGGIVGAVRSKLILIDRYSGVAQSVIRFKLKAPILSDKQNIFSLKNSKPFFPAKWSDSPFIPDAVAQSFALNPDKPTMVLTGPNSSGKTVLMFNSYMNAILALSGSYVSGDLEISRFNHILTFFGGHDDVSKGESYFLNVLSKYGMILKNARPNDIIILDELHGTDYFELAAIQLAVLHYLRALNVTVIFNTHVRDGLKILDEKVGLDIWQTDFKYDEKSANVTPLYTVSPDPNLQAKSFGLIVAKEWLTDNQYQRARSIYEHLIGYDKAPPQGNPATLLRYMFANNIDKDRAVMPKDMAKQRGGNDSLSNIYRELAPLERAGLVAGDKGNPRYLPDWVLKLNPEEIIRQNPELSRPNLCEDMTAMESISIRVKRLMTGDVAPGPSAASTPSELSTKIEISTKERERLLNNLLQYDESEKEIGDLRLSPEEISLVLNAPPNWLGLQFAREHHGPLRLLGESDISRILGGEELFPNSHVPQVPRGLFVGRRVLVAPYYGDLPFFIKALGAKEVVGIDIDPLTIACQKLRTLFGKLPWFREYFLRFNHSKRDLKGLVGWLKFYAEDLLLMDTENVAKINDINFACADLTKPLPAQGKFDLIIVPYLFGMTNGIRDINGYSNAFKQLTGSLAQNGCILVMPVNASSSDSLMKHHCDVLADFSDWLIKDGYTVEFSPTFELNEFGRGVCTGGYVIVRNKNIKMASDVQQAFSVLNTEVRKESQSSSSVSKLHGTSQNHMEVNKLKFCLPIEVLRNSPDIALALNSTGLLKQRPQDTENIEFELVVTGVTDEDVKLIEGLNRDDIKKALNLPNKFTVSIITEAQIQQTANRFGYDATNPKQRVAIIKDFFSGALAKGEYMAIATDALDTTEKADTLKEELEKELKDELAQENISIRVLVRPESSKSMYSLSKIINDWLEAINQGNFSTISRILPLPASLTPEIEKALKAAWEVLTAV